MGHDVFICHSHHDAAVAAAACAALEGAGIRCWVAPRNVGAGAYAAQLVEAIAQAKALLLLFSERANASDHVKREIETAASAGKTLIPFRLDATEPCAEVRYFTTRVHWLDDVATPLEQRFTGLVAFVREHIDHEVPFTPPAAVVKAGNLPVELTSFVARDDEIAEITALLATHRLVTLVGSGGVGKTRTSLRVAGGRAGSYTGGAWFIELAPLSSGEYLPSTVATALELKLPAEGDPLESIVCQLGDVRALLLFDNCEHLIEDTRRVVSTLLRGCPGIVVLASSRQALGITGEEAYRLPALPIASAVALFAERAHSSDKRFVLTSESEPIVADICRRLDGIPLAIELAAPRVKILSLRHLRDKLDERFRVLTGGSHDALPRQQTLRALIDWSHDLLDAREQMLFRRLCIFVDGFTIEGATAVGAGDDFDEFGLIDVLASLVDKSLVLADPQGDESRYRMLESTRAYGNEKLDAAGEREACASAHLAYFRELFASLHAHQSRAGFRVDGGRLLQREIDDVRAALDNALRSGPELGASLLAVTVVNSDPWRYAGLEAEAIARCEAYLAVLPAHEAAVRATLLNGVAYLYAAMGHAARALGPAAAAVEFARTSGDPSLLRRCLRTYCWEAIRAGMFEEADRAVLEFEASPQNTPLGTAVALGLRAYLAGSRGDLETALRSREHLVDVMRSLDDESSLCIELMNLAEVYHHSGNTSRAIECSREAIASLRAANDDIELRQALVNYTAYLAAVDDFGGVIEAVREIIALSGAQDASNVMIAVALEPLALAATMRDLPECGALLAGYADGAIERGGFLREYSELTTHERLRATLEASFASAELAPLLAKGATLPADDAVRLAGDVG